MNIELIDKWLENEYGVSYTRLEELHDFVVEQDLKHQEKAEKEIERLKNIINTFEDDLERELRISEENSGLEYKEYILIKSTLKKILKNFRDLNDEVEIIEEEKKIPEKLETYKENNEIFLENFCYKYMPIHKNSLSFNEQVIVDKLNEVLDYLKSKGE